MTGHEIAAGEGALLAYVREVEGWKANFIPEQVFRDGAIAVIRAADDAKYQDGASRASAGQAALRQAIDTKAAAYKDEVTDDMCKDAAAAVLEAVDKLRPAPKPKA